ncbi:MAG: hypothetical protein HOO96_39870 [Polyangiaceae bacterium]|nr:hypothetical protein [Polyangiaceae bacterium]
MQPQKLLRTSLAIATALAVSGVLGPFLGCSSSGGDSTTGKRIVLKARVEAPSAASFTSKQGWAVTLSKAAISTGAFYYYDGATIFAQRAPAHSANPLARFFTVGNAFAHPGHYQAGNARGEMLTATSVDLVAGGADLGVGDGVTGTVRSATFTFGTPPVGPQAATLGTHVVVLEGKAVKGADTRVFRAEIDAADIADLENRPILEGCPFAETQLTADGTVTLTVNVPMWFELVEFDQVAASADGKPVTMDGIARNELVRGLKAGDRYVFTYTK